MDTATDMKNNSPRISIACGLFILCQSSIISAQDAQAFVIKPRISLTETWSDNVSVNGNQNGKESGFITDISPGIRIDAKSARLKAYFDYAFHEQIYSTSSGSSRSQNFLNTFGTLEAVSNWLFLDFSGVIAQQAISAFGPQSPSNANLNNNSTETSTYRLSPYIRGQIAGIVDYSLRYNWSTTQANASAVSNVEVSDWAGQLRGSTPFQNLKWSVDATQQTSTYSQGRTSEAERLYAMAIYTIVPQFRISISGGSESNNYASQNMVSHPTHGYGFDWSPTERTEISAFKERRFFGNGHRYSFNHRFPLSSIRYSDTKDVSVLPNQFTSIGLGTAFDLLYQICSQQLSSSFTDPIQLNEAASTCATNRLSQFGVSPNAQVTSDFLRSQATLQRTQQLAMAFQGARNTLTVMFNRNQSQSMLAFDGISQDNTNSIRQRGISVNLSHQLSALTSLSVMASRQESTGAGSSNLKAKTAMYQANLSSPLGAKTTGSISVRHTEFDSTINPYTENAIIGTVSVIF
jgi:uncharacterized protein (PEP-CTERM system associated)